MLNYKGYVVTLLSKMLLFVQQHFRKEDEINEKNLSAKEASEKKGSWFQKENGYF